jgi:hypothetical protein
MMEGEASLVVQEVWICISRREYAVTVGNWLMLVRARGWLVEEMAVTGIEMPDLGDRDICVVVMEAEMGMPILQQL